MQTHELPTKAFPLCIYVGYSNLICPIMRHLASISLLTRILNQHIHLPFPSLSQKGVRYIYTYIRNEKNLILPALYPLGKALNLKGGEDNNGMSTRLQAGGNCLHRTVTKGTEIDGRVCLLNGRRQDGGLRWVEGYRVGSGHAQAVLSDCIRFNLTLLEVIRHRSE